LNGNLSSDAAARLAAIVAPPHGIGTGGKAQGRGNPVKHGISNSQRGEVRAGLRVDPRVVLRSQLLELTLPELEQAIEAELSENPALERLEEEHDPVTEECVLEVVAPQELRPSSEDFEFRRSLPTEDAKPDWVELAASAPSLSEHLRGQLLPSLRPELRDLGEFLIASLDAKGYLGCTAEEAAQHTGRSEREAEEAIEALQSCEPAGIGAGGVQECLLLQLRDADTVERRLARIIVRRHLDEFIARRTSRLMRRYKVLPEVVEDAFQVILSLNPFPGESYSNGHAHGRSLRTPAVTPDLELNRREAGWTIVVMGAEPAAFAVNRAYQNRLSELKSNGKGERGEAAHLSTFVGRAEKFIDALAERRRTMRRIGEYLIRHQESFITTGRYEFLLPLTRAQLARELGVHESTVSRATMGKFVRIANDETVAFEVFFKPALRVQKMIEEILSTENPKSPLSDEQIAKLLAKKGVKVARRTVNKYRDRKKLLSSRARRTA